MKYYLRQEIIGSAAELPITENQFRSIAAARRQLTAAFALEEAYDLLVANYVELEQELLAAAAETVAQSLAEYEEFFLLRSKVNRRAVNLLTAARLYIDQAPQRLGACSTNSNTAKSEFKGWTSAHYDTSSSYRFLEALRNHVQHCGVAVHKLSVGSQWIEVEGTRLLEASVSPFTIRKYLEEDKQFKGQVLTECPEEVNLMGYVRKYLQCLGDVHQHVRSVASPVAKAARDLLQTHISQYGESNNGQTIGLAAIQAHESGAKQSIPLLLDWDDVRIRLTKKNRTLGSLSKQAVSSRVSPS